MQKIEFSLNSGGGYVMDIEGRFYKIGISAKETLEILASSDTYEKACQAYNLKNTTYYSVNEFKQIAEGLLNKFQLDKKSKSFLTVEKVLLNPKFSSAISKWFVPLFNPTVFWGLFFTMLFLGIYRSFFLLKHSSQIQNSVSFWYLFIFYNISIIFHEIGHIAACRRFTGKSGEMGVGLYIIFPVLFSNISPIWRATKMEKVITNLAGVYMQSILATICLIISLFYNYGFLEQFYVMITIYSLLQILPFVRTDGYWLLSDILDVPNLQKKSDKGIIDFISAPLKILKQSNSKQFWILSYGLINNTFIFFFIWLQFKYSYNEILSFPIYLMGVFKKILTLNFQNLNFEYKYVTVLILYYVLFGLAKKLIAIIRNGSLFPNNRK